MSALGLFLLLLVGFLGLLGMLAFAVTKTAGADGTRRHGLLGGCAAALVLVFLSGMGVIGTGAYLAALAIGTAVEANPIEKIEIRRGERDQTSANSAEEQEPVPVHLLFTVRGEIGSELADFVCRITGMDPAELDDFLSIVREETSDGSELWVYDFCLPLTERDVSELEEEIPHELDGLRLRLPRSVAIHFEGAKRLH